jgi:coenzyme F420-0:L-glutamate ligase / coenzyme F420-1:gamma-L-glutamate ligase
MEAEIDPNMDFWSYLDSLVAQSELVIDRPRGSAHPRLPEVIYPLDYGYLAETSAMDGGGVDVWLGSLPDRRLDAVMLTVDLFKRDTELKLMLGCTPEEKQIALDFTSQGSMRAVLIARGGELAWLRTRRSVRKFQSRPVPEDLLRQVLETATWAPSAHNRQPWRFAVLQTPQAKSDLADAMSAAFKDELSHDGLDPEQIERRVFLSHRRITNAPAAVLLCLDPSLGDPYPDPFRQQAELEMGVQGVAMAGCTLLLAAHAVGLAGVWLCAPLFAPEAVRQTLHLPDAWLPQALVLLGYPESTPEPPGRLDLEEVTIYR